MFVFQYDFFPDLSRTSIEEFVENWLHSFLASLCRSGNILEGPWHLVQIDGHIRLFGTVPTPDALDDRHYNRYASADFARLLEHSRQPPSLLLLGAALGMPECCSCEEPSWYILFTTFISQEPPVRCGDCGQPVPLYRLSLPEGEDEPASIRHWAGTYQACDTLFMLSATGERFGYRQMARFDSPLTREGREICQAMMDRMGKPWYYYLTRYYSPQAKTCPGCGDAWRLDESLHRLYDYKCDRCRLLSTEPAR